MMKVKVGLGLAIVLVLSVIVAHAQQSVSGAWVLSVQGMSMQMVLAQTGDKIAGTLDSPHGELKVTGEFSKGKLTLTGSGDASHPVQLSASATLNVDGSLSGTLSANSMEMTFTAVRSVVK